MVGKPQGAQPRDQFLKIRITKDGMEVLDEIRGAMTRSEYVRKLIADDYRRHV